MAEQFTIPEEYEMSFRRLIPYLVAPLQNNPQVLASLLLYIKLGGEKLARAAIDALNVSRRLEDAELVRLLREEALSSGLQSDESEDDDDDASSDEDEDENEDKDIDA